jgi:hypothetical protein
MNGMVWDSDVWPEEGRSQLDLKVRWITYLLVLSLGGLSPGLGSLNLLTE